jgi:hypothetical protein
MTDPDKGFRGDFEQEQKVSQRTTKALYQRTHYKNL